MPDPEKLYARATAGAPSSVVALSSEIAAQDPAVIEALDHVTAGIGGTRWTGGLATAPAWLAARTVYVDGTFVAWRLHRAASVLDDLAADLADVETWAGKAIRIWRERPEMPPAFEALWRDQVSLYLGSLCAWATGRMRQAAGELTTFDADLLEWLRVGAGKDFDWGVRYGGQRGPRVPDAAAGGDGGTWTPQGLGYDEANDRYYTTSYRTDPNDPADKHDDVDDSLLSVVNPDTGKVEHQVRLLGEHGGAGPEHSGGVAVDSGTVFVVGGGKVYEYSAKAVEDAGPGGSVRPLRVIPDPPASSYVTIAGGRIYFGDWGNNKVYSYPIVNGQPVLSDRVREVYDTPEGTNGIAVLPGNTHVYSVNDGRVGEGALVVDDGAEQRHLDVDRTVPVGNLPEELVLVDGKVIGTTESGSGDYAPWDLDGEKGGADGVNDTGGSEGKDLAGFWAQTHMFEVPVELLTGQVGSDGFYVEPITLVDGAKELWGTSDSLSAVRTALLGLHLPASVLPELPGADELSTALDTRLDEDRGDLRHLAGASDRIGTSLKDTADDYTVTDLLSGQSVAALAQKLVDG